MLLGIVVLTLEFAICTSFVPFTGAKISITSFIILQKNKRF